jgi:predicted metal-binding membrane protein
MIANPSSAARRHERTAVLVGLAALIATSWIYLLLGAGIEMDKMDMGGGAIMLMAPAWTVGHAALVLLMWAVMMTAMMLPGAAPAILRVVGLAHEQADRTGGVAAALRFTAGYLMIWIAFSIAATLLQWGLDSAGLLSETMAIGGPAVAAALVAAVGLYQLTPLKQACLRHCRACADCLPGNATESAGGMVERGLRYGISCLGCCGALMGLLFVGGVMNVVWMVAIAIGVLAEKLLPRGAGAARLAGAGLIAWGGIALAVAFL